MADKYLYNNAGTITEREAKIASAGAGDSGRIPALDATGKLDASFMPVGITADTAVMLASEALAAGDFVNVHNVAGVAKARKADATVAGKEAHGFVTAAVLINANATVYFEGSNAGVAGQTPGVVFLQTVAGTAGTAAPAGAGNVVQRVGVASSATSINIGCSLPVVLA